MLGLAFQSNVNPSVPANIGGLTPVMSLSAMQSQHDAQALGASQARTLDALAAHIRTFWDRAKQAKMEVEQDMLRAVRARRGQYDPDKLAKIRQQGGSEIFMMLTSVKCRQAGALLRDAMMGTGSEKPWTLRPTPLPELPPDRVSEIMGLAASKVYSAQMAGVQMDQTEIRAMLRELKDSAEASLREMSVKMTERMERKMEDQLTEGGFLEALDQFIDDLTTFKTAFVKGPVVRRVQTLKWVTAPGGGYTMQLAPTFQLQWERVDPFNIYPAPYARNIQDGPLIERHKLTRPQLDSLIGVEGYDSNRIRAVLGEWSSGALREWTTVDAGRVSAEGRDATAAMTEPDVVDALQYWGTVQGQMLMEWGMSAPTVTDPTAEYSVEAWMIGSHVIKAVINPDPLKRRPYFANSYERIPGVLWGNSLYDLIADCQDMCNSAARALANNLGISSGPQVAISVDRLAPGEKITQMYPWKIWQTQSDAMGSTSPAISFFQPSSHAAELMGVYERFSLLADEYSGVPKYMTGTEGTPGAGRTASGLSMMIGNATKTIKQVVSSVDVTVLKPLLEMLYTHNMLYAEDTDLKGDVNIVARGALSLMVKEAAQVRRNEFLAATANPVDMQIIGIEGRAEVLRAAAQSLDMNVDKIVPTGAAIRQQQMVAQQQQMVAQQQQPSAPGSGQQLMNGAPTTDNFQPT